MTLNQRACSCAAVIGALFATVGEVSASNVTLALGGEAVIGAQGANGYKATLDDAALVWHFSNGISDPVKEPPLVVRGAVGGLVGSLNVIRADVQPVGNAQVLSKDITIQTNYLRFPIRGGLQVSVPADAGALDLASGAIKAVSGAGGVTLDAPLMIEGVLDGGRFSVSGLRVDYDARALYGNLSGGYEGPQGWVPQAAVENIQLFTFGSISGPVGLSPDAVGSALDGDTTALTALGWGIESSGRNALGLVGWSQMAGLKITDEAFGYLINALGATQGGTGYNLLNSVNGWAEGWGTLRVGLGMRVTDLTLDDGPGAPWRDTLAPVRLVPEPSTYALMGLGLVGLAWVRARRQA